MRAGRPLRFLVTVFAGWTGVRTVLLWPERVVRTAAAASAPAALAPNGSPSPWTGLVPTRAAAGPVPLVAIVPHTRLSDIGVRTPPPLPFEPPVDTTVPKRDAAQGPPFAPALQGSLPTPLGEPNRSAESRWSGSLFAIARPSGRGGGLGSSQLGGSQVGARIAYSLDAGRRFALVGRIATPLEGRGREAALGAEWRPSGLPVRFFAEQRIALDGGRGGPSLGVIAGIDRVIGGDFRLEAYGQAGIIERRDVEGFADGAARATRRVASIGSTAIDLGAGAWGGAQRGAERLDIGPTLGVAVPVAGRTLRLTLDCGIM